ncbi:MAG: ABC transporter permease [Hyphomicrobiales bacterium]|nr:ABC transporter permease [Hyphomicrobiales bacterium]MDE2016312.1 ABC transporter permease [Hyphomicrobiales bacterium]
MASSIKSTAMEPTRADLAGLSPLDRAKRYAPVYGLPILAALLAVFFALLLPDTFPTLLNLRSIVSDKSIIAILSLAVMIPMATGKIDLTVGYGIVLWHILAISLQVNYGVPWPVAVVVVIALGGLVGLLNGALVEVAQIDSFIATLGTGTILYSIAMWHSQGRQIVGVAPDAFYALSAAYVLGLPVTGFYVLALALAMWIALEYLPIGRYFYAIGANPKAAALNGVPVRRYTMLAFVASGLLTGFAGVLLAARLRIGQASVGLEYLLPALVGAFLGSTTIKPGRVNVWGTLVGVAILAIGIAGIQQLGASFFVEPLFNGATLLVAIGIAGYAQRRRAVGSTRAPAEPAQTNVGDAKPAPPAQTGGNV